MKPLVLNYLNTHTADVAYLQDTLTKWFIDLIQVPVSTNTEIPRDVEEPEFDPEDSVEATDTDIGIAFDEVYQFEQTGERPDCVEIFVDCVDPSQLEDAESDISSDEEKPEDKGCMTLEQARSLLDSANPYEEAVSQADL